MQAMRNSDINVYSCPGPGVYCTVIVNTIAENISIYLLYILLKMKMKITQICIPN